MGVKEKLIELKNKILLSNSSTNYFDDDIILEDHPIGEQNIYRLCYVNYSINKKYYSRKNNISMLNWQYEPFVFPYNMTRQDGFKVISYFLDFYYKKEGKDSYSLNLFRKVDSVFDKNDLGFVRVSEMDENKVLDLFIVGGNLLLFKESELYKKYFNWYIKDVSFEEVKEIYKKYGIDFCCDSLIDEEKHPRILKK